MASRTSSICAVHYVLRLGVLELLLELLALPVLPLKVVVRVARWTSVP